MNACCWLQTDELDEDDVPIIFYVTECGRQLALADVDEFSWTYCPFCGKHLQVFPTPTESH